MVQQFDQDAPDSLLNGGHHCLLQAFGQAVKQVIQPVDLFRQAFPRSAITYQTVHGSFLGLGWNGIRSIIATLDLDVPQAIFLHRLADARQCLGLADGAKSGTGE
jgi:hypothetical protein